ncbi:MAG: hypothetical protein ACP5IG_04340 [Candidatus Micrarchaeia archaeon]|jgi:hypothetical protein
MERQSISQKEYVIKKEHLHPIVKSLVEEHLELAREENNKGEASLPIWRSATASKAKTPKNFFLNEIARKISQEKFIDSKHANKYSEERVLKLVYSHVRVNKKGDLVLSREGEARTLWQKFLNAVKPPAAAWKEY